ncbi:MAG TPA: tripartite tricarboxylate transporter substrate-binding protein [Quisquiliibacterium sp.]|nr:tripartite tricarboxylate transporter substrate-binding protein [Quisquiliibacterium sp.]
MSVRAPLRGAWRGRRLGALLMAGALCVTLPGAARAQGLPSGPLRLVVPLSAGGVSDVLARLLAARLGERLGQPVTVENRPGAGGNIAIEHVARAAPDGQTMLMAPTMLVINPTVSAARFDPLKDFAPVTLVGETPMTLVVSNRLQVASVEEFVALLRSSRAGLTCGSAGGLQTIACAMLRQHSKVEITEVPYRGGSQAMHDLVLGDIDVYFALGNTAAEYVGAGRARAIASTDSRSARAAAAGLPVLSASLPGFVLMGWQAVVMPAGTPRAVAGRLQQELAAVLADPELRARLVAMNVEPVGSTPEQLAKVLEADVQRFGRVAREAGLRRD